MSTELAKTSSKASSKASSKPSLKMSAKSRNKGRTSSQEECDQVHESIKRWKAHDGAVLIPVVRQSTIASLKEKAKPRWWKLQKSAKSTLCITTPDRLQREIDSTASDGQVQEVFLLVSRQVDLPELHFDVPSTIANLYIIRCTTAAAQRTDNNNNTPQTNKLVLNGASTFCGVRLDEWQAKRAAAHNLILGPGVVIQLRGMAIPWGARDALGALSKTQREEVARHVREMCEARYEGAPQWDKWRGPVNKLLDVAAGRATASSVVECYAGGIVVQAATKLTEWGMDRVLQVSAGLLCVSGPGQLAVAGVGVAAAIYFVPWDTVWAWFRLSFGALMSWLVRAWENLKSWVTNAAATKAIDGRQSAEMVVRPLMMVG